MKDSKIKVWDKSVLIIVVAICLVWIVNIIWGGGNKYWIALTGGGELFSYGNVSYDSVWSDHQVYRLVTYGYLHMGILHLLANLLAIWYVGNLLVSFFGKIKFLLLYHIGLILPAIFWIAVFPNDSIVGASPAIFACFGVLMKRLLRNKDLIVEYRKCNGFRYLLLYMIVSNFLSLGTALIHALGLVIGFLFGAFIDE